MNSFVAVCVIVAIFGTSLSLPVYDPSTGEFYKNITTLNDIPGYNTSNGTAKELYVIKAVVYEVGILSEVDDNATDLDNYDYNQSSEQVDLSFYGGHRSSNSSRLDFGDIPLPIQQQINGQIITGIAPVNFDGVGSADDILRTLPLTGTVINVTDSQNTLVNFSRHNVSEDASPTVIKKLNFNNVPVEGNSIPVLPEPIQEAPIFQPKDLTNTHSN